MNDPIRILGIAGSLRRNSHNRGAPRAAVELAPEGTMIETFELDGIPIFNQDEEQHPPAQVTKLKRRIRESDAVLFVTPENFDKQKKRNAVNFRHSIVVNCSTVQRFGVRDARNKIIRPGQCP